MEWNFNKYWTYRFQINNFKDCKKVCWKSSTRFTRTFALEDTVEVKDAAMMNGMLKVFLERIIPEHKKPKKIEVKDSEAGVKTKAKRQLLSEDPESRVL